MVPTFTLLISLSKPIDGWFPMINNVAVDPCSDPYHGGIGQHDPIRDNIIISENTDIAST